MIFQNFYSPILPLSETIWLVLVLPRCMIHWYQSCPIKAACICLQEEQQQLSSCKKIKINKKQLALVTTASHFPCSFFETQSLRNFSLQPLSKWHSNFPPRLCWDLAQELFPVRIKMEIWTGSVLQLSLLLNKFRRTHLSFIDYFQVAAVRGRKNEGWEVGFSYSVSFSPTCYGDCWGDRAESAYGADFRWVLFHFLFSTWNFSFFSC